MYMVSVGVGVKRAVVWVHRPGGEGMVGGIQAASGMCQAASIKVLTFLALIDVEERVHC